jgi:hypothetical protein
VDQGNEHALQPRRVQSWQVKRVFDVCAEGCDMNPSREKLLRQIAECREAVAEMRKLYPHAMRWAVARIPKMNQKEST